MPKTGTIKNPTKSLPGIETGIACANYSNKGEKTMSDSELPSKPPYLSYTTFRNFLANLKRGVIPTRVDKSTMPGQSGATQSYLLSALRFFKLIDERGVPQDGLHKMLEGTDAEATAAWKELFEAGYGPVIEGLNLERASAGELQDRFQKLGLGGATLRKAQSFFVAAAVAADIPLGPHLKPNARTPGPRRSRRSKAVQNGQGIVSSDQIIDAKPPPGHRSATLPLDSEGQRLVKLDAPVTVTDAELKRIQQWLSFQLIVANE